MLALDLASQESVPSTRTPSAVPLCALLTAWPSRVCLSSEPQGCCPAAQALSHSVYKQMPPNRSAQLGCVRWLSGECRANNGVRGGAHTVSRGPEFLGTKILEASCPPFITQRTESRRNGF